ncbi:MAG: MOSC domain-containing protein [Planctomycetota bacterium]
MSQEPSELQELMSRFHRSGTVRWIGVRPARRAPLNALEEVRAEVGSGLVGDRFDGTGKRQVSLIQAEHLFAVASLMRQEGASIEPADVRRNLVISGINLLALRKMRFRIGEALFEGAGPCPPCSRMEEVLGRGGYQAMRGHGGIVARVLEPGVLRIGDPVEAV